MCSAHPYSLAVASVALRCLFSRRHRRELGGARLRHNGGLLLRALIRRPRHGSSVRDRDRPLTCGIVYVERFDNRPPPG